MLRARRQLSAKRPARLDAVAQRESRATTGALSGARAKPPRLVLRFALYTAIGLAFAASAILLFVQAYVTAQAENSVKYHARFLANVALADHMSPDDFAGPVGPRRRAELDRVFANRVLLGHVVRALLVGPDGRVTYAKDAALIGSVSSEAGRTRELIRGTSIHSTISSAPSDQADSSEKVLKVLVPVRFDDGKPVGVFVMHQDYAPIAQTARQAFIPVAAVLVVVLVALYASLFPILRRVTRRMRQQLDEIEHQALHDGLTGLPNRMLFRDRIEQALASGRRSGDRFAVMVMDLDRFKEINDTLGHQSGDKLLQELGLRLRGLLREGDTIARLGGDEFGIIAPLTSTANLDGVVQRIHGVVERPFVLEGIPVTVGGSVGVALFPDDGDDVETLTKRADAAMYRAKEAGMWHAFYEPGGDVNDAGRLALAAELRQGLDRGELVLHFQPKTAIERGRIESVEALVRWQHPVRGLLRPDEFLDAAADGGLIEKLTTRVLEGAIRQCRGWDEAGLNLRVAADVDIGAFVGESFVDEVARLVEKWELEPNRLELEIAEATLGDVQRVAGAAERLRALGVQLVIDHFGVAASSLAKLEALPVSEVKLDPSLIAPMTATPRGETLVRSIVEVATSRGLRVVGEGVEKEQEARMLAELGCSLAQGSYFASPLPADEALEALRKGAKKRRKRQLGGSPRTTSPAAKRAALATS